MKQFNQRRDADRPRKPKKRVDAARQRKLALAAAEPLPAEDKGKLAAELLNEAPLCREVFSAFWGMLDGNNREELASWIGLALDGDEHEAELVG